MIEIDNILEVEKYLDDVDAVVFDMDDTLYSEKDYVRSGYKAVAEQFGNIDAMEEKLWVAFEQKTMAINTVLADEKLLTDDNLKSCLNTYRYHIPSIELYEGIEDMLSRIRKSGKRIGVITDGRPEGQRAKIKSLGLEILVDEIIVTDELGGIEYRKPNEKAFVLMREKMEVPYGKMVYVGDNITKDFIAPQNLGMKSIWFRNEDGLYYGKVN